MMSSYIADLGVFSKVTQIAAWTLFHDFRTRTGYEYIYFRDTNKMHLFKKSQHVHDYENIISITNHRTLFNIFFMCMFIYIYMFVKRIGLKVVLIYVMQHIKPLCK